MTTDYTYFNKLKDNGIYLRESNKDIEEYLKHKDNRLTPLTTKFIASRYNDINKVKDLYTHTLADVMSKEYISGLPDIQIASDTILKHIKKGNKILLVSDNDVDGITSGVLGKLMFNNILNKSIDVILNNKRVLGYGINDTLTEKILRLHKINNYSLIITSDHGSSDRINLKKLTDITGADLIVTDHHLISDHNSPTTPIAFVNPQKEDCTMGKTLSGAHVIYYMLLYTAYEMYNDKIPLDKVNKIYYYLTYVGLTIVSDFMRLDNYVNRKVLIKALGLINSNKIKHNAFWNVIKNKVKGNYYINETTLSFDVIPLLNSTGRIDDPNKAYNLMLADEIGYGEYLYEDILKVNDRRKDIQNKGVLSKNTVRYENDLISINIDKDVNFVQGILASKRLNDYNYMLSLYFVPSKDNTTLSGSGRMNTSSGDNLKDIITNVGKKSDLILEHGGHAGAVGLKIKNKPDEFFKLLEEEVKNNTNLKRDDKIYVDDIIYSNKKLITTIYDIRNGGPYGSSYPKPVFVSDVVIDSYRVYDKKHNIYLSMMVKINESTVHTVNVFYSIPMKIKDEFLEELKITKRVRIIYSLSINNYRDNNKISLDALKVILR